MSLELRDCTFAGPAMPEPFVKFRLEELLNKKKLLVKATGDDSKRLQESWQVYRNKLRSLGEQGLEQRVLHHVLEPLVERLGWQLLDKAEAVTTREGREEGGYLLRILPTEGQAEAPHLRAWVYPVGTDLDAPNKRGRAYRFSPGLVAQRVLLAKGERVGLLTDGLELRVLLSDPSGRDSHIGIRLDRSGGWRASREVPDSFRLLRALCQPTATGGIAELLNEARLSQSSVTKKLREQARHAVETFIQGLLDDPANGEVRNRWSEDDEAANELWREGLVLVYRLLFILKLETSPDPARAFSFASSSLWRNSYSPSTALAPVVERVRDDGAETGEFLAHGLRALFRLFSHGLTTNELHVSPLGGMLFGKEATPILDSLHWSEHAVAHLLDALLWTPADKKSARGTDAGRERVHYGSLDVEDLGRIYEALLELEPGIASQPMCRLRRAKSEVVVPIAQGAPYRAAVGEVRDEAEVEAEGSALDEEEEDDGESSKLKTKVAFIEEIPEGRFYLRIGLGRKASGSYYTPHAFVRFLVQETLGPQIVERSPQDDPNPLAILGLKVLDPAMGSGHFLVEACRFLGDALYEACRLCDERALEAQKRALNGKAPGESERFLERALTLWKRVEDLPDPNDELVAYLPSRVLEGEESGLSQRKALALCRRLVAVHCLYGVDKNPLAVELARVSLWLESYAEGLPLTFLEHRLICGDSLTGPFFQHLLTYPGSGERINNLFVQGVTEKLTRVLSEALTHVRDLEATIGKDSADIELKRVAKAKLDGALQPLKVLAAAWAGGVMLGKDACDDAGYEHLLRSIAEKEDPDAPASSRPGVAEMVRSGWAGVPYDLVFPEVYFPDGHPDRRWGFAAILGNPPWEKLRVERRDAVSQTTPQFLEGREVAGIQREHEHIGAAFNADRALQGYQRDLLQLRNSTERLAFLRLSRDARPAILDLYQAFLLRLREWTSPTGRIGLVVGGGFARSPTEISLRELVSKSDFSASHVAHFLNLRQLFAGASSRVSFVVIALGPRGSTVPSTETGSDLTSFEQLDKLSPLYGLSATSTNPLRPGELSEGRRPREIGNALDALTQLQINVSEGLHRTESKPFLHALTDVVSDQTDAREPQIIKELVSAGYACLYAGRSIDFFDPIPRDKSGKWTPQVDLVVDLHYPRLATHVRSLGFFRLAWRNTCGLTATNERSARAVILPPGATAAGSIILEWSPEQRPNAHALLACAILNSFPFDARVRSLVQTNFNKALLGLVAWPEHLSQAHLGFLVHSALRLSCAHELYEPLWREQVDDAWLEGPQARGWPILRGAETRWLTRSILDAVVAHAYDMTRDAYKLVLSKFKHRTYPKAPDLCLAAFDELTEIGLNAFVAKHDPFWKIPLVTALPKPVFDLSGAEPASGAFHLESVDVKPTRRRPKTGRTA